jgi:phosphoglycolate phosphatase-like HAD superfamily hydrolase
MTPPAVAIDLDGALGDTRGLWLAFLEDASRRFRSIAELDPGSLPADRGEAAAELDRWASSGVGDWRGALKRFAEDRAPVHLRPSSEAGACVRALATRGVRVGVFTDAPEELAQVALDHLGVARRVDALEAGPGSLDRLLERLGARAATVVRTPDELRRAAS